MPKRGRRERLAQRRKESMMLEELRRLGPQIKQRLRQLGCTLPFYDYLDSYEDEFRRFCRNALTEMPSILGIHEVDAEAFKAKDWPKYGVGTYRQVFFEVDDRFADYNTVAPNTHLQASATFFDAGDGHFKTVVLIPPPGDSEVEDPDLKYAIKVVGLLHELGHVYDAEHGIKIDPCARRMDVVKAEAFAHCYALEKLAERAHVPSYNMTYDALHDLSSKPGYEGEIGRLIVDTHARRQLVNWQDTAQATNG